MTAAATILGGAKGRLLPASIPLRFFAAAAVFHVLGWAAVLAGADAFPSFRGGPGPILAAIHLVTLGVLTTTAIGASVQLLPVATRHALAAVWPVKLVFWLTVPGIAALTLGIYVAQVQVLIVAAWATSAGLLLFAALLADNLRRAGNLPVVAAYGWAALAALVALVLLGLGLTLNYAFDLLPAHGAAALAHFILAAFGFMGLLAIGFSHILVPMFALSAVPERRTAWTGFGLAAAAVSVATLGALASSATMIAAGAVIGLLAIGVHLWLMLHALQTGMRKRLGLSFVLVRSAWAMLAATIPVGLAALFGTIGRSGAMLFGLLALGWLLTFTLGILQRILPFLASMHFARSPAGMPPLVSELAAAEPLKLHAACHGIALALLAASILGNLAWLAFLGGAIGLVGALAFAWFTADVIRRVAGAPGAA